MSGSGPSAPPSAPEDRAAEALGPCIVLLLGHPATGKRTVGGAVARLLDGVLLDNALINRPVLEALRWDGVAPLPPGTWDLVAPVRAAVLRAVEHLAPPSASHVFTTVIEDGPGAGDVYDEIRSLARRRRAVFLAVMLHCDLDEQVSRIDNADRVALRKGSDPEGYREYTLATALFQPPAAEVLHLDTTSTAPDENARRIVAALRDRAPSTAG